MVGTKLEVVEFEPNATESLIEAVAFVPIETALSAVALAAVPALLAKVPSCAPPIATEFAPVA